MITLPKLNCIVSKQVDENGGRSGLTKFFSMTNVDDMRELCSYYVKAFVVLEIDGVVLSEHFLLLIVVECIKWSKAKWET